MMAPCVKQLLSCKRFFILFATPLLLLPLPLIIRSKEASCAYTIILMAVYWCTEVIPLAVTALLPVLLFPMFGILESKQVCMQYLKDTNMMFVGGLIVAVAVEHWNLHKRIALKVLLIVGVSPPLLMLGFMGVTAFLSMWISNTATTAMMVPIVQAVLGQLSNTEQEPSILDSDGQTNPALQLDEKNAISMIDMQNVANGHTQDISLDAKERKEKKHINKGMMLCVCYAASIGGTATLTGTGPNLVLKGQFSAIFPNNGDILNFASWFGFAFPNMIIMLCMAWLWLQISFLGINLKKTWGCGTSSSEKERAAYNIIREEYRKLGPISFAESSVLLLFSLLVILWFTRDPGFVKGWATVLFNKDNVEYVTDATVAIFVAVLLFILPAQRPKIACGKQRNSFDTEDSEEELESCMSAPLLTWKVVHKQMPWSIVVLLGGGFALAKGSDFPTSVAEWKAIAEDFNRRWNYPNCGGAIDGKHVRITKPTNSGSDYYNYKGYFSIVLMAVVNANYEFIFLDDGKNGRCSDGGSLKNTHFYDRLTTNSIHLPPVEQTKIGLGFVFMADEAFALHEHIMKPYPRRVLNHDRRIFNYRLSRARRVVENAFGILSNRFRIFRKPHQHEAGQN